MVKYSYIDQFQGILQTPGNILVGETGFCDARRMIVRKNHVSLFLTSSVIQELGQSLIKTYYNSLLESDNIHWHPD